MGMIDVAIVVLLRLSGYVCLLYLNTLLYAVLLSYALQSTR